jgi:hypothetical protein
MQLEKKRHRKEQNRRRQDEKKSTKTLYSSTFPSQLWRAFSNGTHDMLNFVYDDI